MERSEKYWLDPDGRVLPVPLCHVASVIGDPARFGLTGEEVREAYRRCAEPLGLEGRARAAILARLFAAGWVRVRHFERTDTWGFQFAADRPEALDGPVAAFVEAAVAAGIPNRYADVEFLLTPPGGPAEPLSSAERCPGGTFRSKFHELSRLAHQKHGGIS